MFAITMFYSLSCKGSEEVRPGDNAMLEAVAVGERIFLVPRRSKNLMEHDVISVDRALSRA